MAQNTMYVSKNNSPQTELTNEITATEQTIPVADISKLPAAPNIVSIGSGDDIELVYYAGISGSTLTGCVRGYHGTTASVWYEDTPVYRAYTSYDHDTFKSNIEDLATNKLDKTGDGSSTTVAFTEAGTMANPATGESQATLWGKILKLFNQTSGHDHNGANSKKIAYSDINEAPTKATVEDVIVGASDSTYITPAVLHETTLYPVFGVSWDGGENPTLTRMNASNGMVANAGVDDQIVRNDFDYVSIFGEFEDYTDNYGNEFVAIPKCYIKKTAVGAARTWQISKRRIDGAYLPTCFWDFEHNRELPYVLIGKYTANLSDDGTKLESKSGKWPLVNKNIVEFRNYAQANGTGYQQLDGVIVDLLQTLFYIEFATLDSQSIMMGWAYGRMSASDIATVSDTGVNRIIVSNATAAYYKVGQPIGIGTTLGGGQIFNYRTIVSIEDYDESNKAIVFDGIAVDVTAGNILYNLAWKSGACSGVVSPSGSLFSNSDGLHPFKYRGIENLWGNIYQFVDGININNNQAWIARNPADYASNLFANPYQQLSYIDHNVNDYISQMGFDSVNPEFQLPTSITGGAYNKYYADYYYQSTGQRIARLGGSWVDGLRPGLSCWVLTAASGDSYVAMGGRLVKKALE